MTTLAEGVLAEGTLYMDRYVAGAYTGLEQMPGIAKLEIKPGADLKDLITKDKGKYGQIIGTVAVPKPTELAILLRGITASALAIALSGDYSVYSQGSGTVTDQVVTARLGKWIDLGKKNISATGFVLTNAAGSTTYVNGTDYEVNYVTGFLHILSDGAITDDQSLKVDFTYAAVSGTKVRGSTVPQIRGKLFLDGRNLFDNTPLHIDIWDATLTADSPVDFMSDSPIELSMTGRMSTPSDKPSPYEVVYGIAMS